MKYSSLIENNSFIPKTHLANFTQQSVCPFPCQSLVDRACVEQYLRLLTWTKVERLGPTDF